jgi:hypothetical protein
VYRGVSVLAVILLLSGIAVADPISSIPIGFISFDLLIPPAEGPGVNVFSISNFTGDFGLPPDFPVLDSLVFVDSTLTLTGENTTEVIPLGNLGPGVLDPIVALQFADTSLFSAAIFQATLSGIDLHLSDGSTFLASPTVNARLLPSSGSFLTAGTDFALIEAMPEQAAPVPEPATLVLLGSSIAILVVMRVRRTRHN